MDEQSNIDITEDEMERVGQGICDLAQTFLKSFDSWQQVTREKEDLLKCNNHHAGKLIQCHLIIDNLLNDTLICLNNFSYKKVSSMKFAEKIKKLPKDRKLFCKLIPGLEKLNILRNQIAHNLNFSITPIDMQEIDIYLTFFKLGNPLNLSVEQRIEKFTSLCILLFNVNSPQVTHHWDSFSNKYPNFFEELKIIEERVNIGLAQISNNKVN